MGTRVAVDTIKGWVGTVVPDEPLLPQAVATKPRSGTTRATQRPPPVTLPSFARSIKSPSSSFSFAFERIRAIDGPAPGGPKTPQERAVTELTASDGRPRRTSTPARTEVAPIWS